MQEVKTNNLVFNDNKEGRYLLSKEYNFALDKKTGVSMCWGKTMNDAPKYDPIRTARISSKYE